MSAATLFCFPSIYEGFSLPPLEAAACGTPVICGAAAAMPEIMEDAAAYVDPLDPQDIAAALQNLLRDEGLRHQLSQRGIERAAEFNWTRCAEATVDCYRSVV